MNLKITHFVLKMKIEPVEEEIKSEEASVEDKGLKPNNDNGYDFEKYKWTQDASSVSLYFPISKNVRCKDISVEIHPNSIEVYIEGIVVFGGELFGTIKVDNCTWLINNDERREIIVELDKKKFDEWFPYVIKGEPVIDLSLVRPPQAQISDLDQETRATINKMMFEQEQKEKSGFYKDRM